MKDAKDNQKMELKDALPGKDRGIDWLVSSGIKDENEAKRVASIFRGKLDQLSEQLEQMDWPQSKK